MIFARRLFVAALLAVSTFGCARTGPFHPRHGSLPLQRAIPLRFVVLVHCDGCTDCRRSCRGGPSEESFARSVSAANETFAAAAIRFDIASIEQVESPTFWLHGAEPEQRTWAQVRDELMRMFPWMPAGAWADPNETKTTRMWHATAAAAYTRPNEITVFVQAGGSAAATAFPERGRGIWASDGSIGRNLYLLAHELTHYFGLRHPFAHAGTNPATGDPWRLSDRWDLVYRPGSGPHDPHRFFSSRQEAKRHPERELRLIESMHGSTSSCSEARDGSIECLLPGRNGYSETRRSGDPALKGLSMPLGQHENRRFRYARNASDYGSWAVPRRLSASQIEMIRLTLQNPSRVSRAVLKQMGRLPAGADALPSYRTTLGLPY